MKEIHLSLKILGKIIVGLFIGLVGLSIVLGMIAIIIFPESEVIKTQLSDSYYFTQQTHGWATTSTIREIKIYENRKFWFNKKIADLSMYYNQENVHVEINDNIITVRINFEIRVTHDMNLGTIKLKTDEFWWKEETGKRK